MNPASMHQSLIGLKLKRHGDIFELIVKYINGRLCIHSVIYLCYHVEVVSVNLPGVTLIGVS